MSSADQPAPPTVRPVCAAAPQPVPDHPVPPRQTDDLTAWFVAVFRTTHPVRVAAALRRAELIAARRFAPATVAAAMQAAITAELHGGAGGRPSAVPVPRISRSPAVSPRVGPYPPPAPGPPLVGPPRR